MKTLKLLAASLLATVLASAARAEEYQLSDVNYEQPPAIGEEADVAHPRWSFYGGAEATYLALNAPDFESDALTDARLIHFGFGQAPRIWLGIQNDCGWGIQSRYWQYQTSAQGSGLADSVFGPPLPDAFEVRESSSLKLYTVDLEAARSLQTDRWWVQGTFGARHGSLEFANHRSAIKLFGNTIPSAQSRLFEQDFFGAGLTSSIQVSRRLAAPEWEVFGSFRGSVLWGRQVVHEADSVLFFGTPLSDTFTLPLDQTRISIWETQIGLQWTHPLACCHGELFVRTAFEYQHWDMQTTGFPLEFTSFDPNKDLDLVGVAFAVGLRR